MVAGKEVGREDGEGEEWNGVTKTEERYKEIQRMVMLAGRPAVLTSNGLISTNPAVKNVQKNQGSALPGTHTKYGTTASGLPAAPTSKPVPPASLSDVPLVRASRPTRRT